MTAKTIHVSSSAGNDAHPGTDVKPVKTLARGLSLAAALGDGATVKVTIGLFAGPVELPSGVEPAASSSPGSRYGLFGLRLSNVRPHVNGARTHGGVIRIGMTCEGESRSDATFDHFTDFVEPGAHDEYEPYLDGHAGKLTDHVLDLVGLFGDVR